MGDGRGQLDMAHAVAPHLRQGDLDAAFLADDAAILHALVLAAQALVVLDRPEDPGAEQPVPLRLEGAVVDRLGLLDLAVGPGTDALRAGDRDADLIEALRSADLPEDVHQLVHQRPLSIKRLSGRRAWRAPSRTRRRAPACRRRCRPLSCSIQAIYRPSEAALLQFDVEAERAQLLDQDVEGFRNPGLEIVVAAHDRLIDLGAAGDVVGFDRQHLLQGIGRAVGFERPHLHLAEALAYTLQEMLT